MRFIQIAALTASLAFAPAQAIRGFNTGNIGLSGAAKSQSDFEAEFKNQKALAGTDGVFNSARLYTMIQGDTTNDPISAIPAAISTNTGLLLGMWASAGQDAFNDELAALKTAIQNYPGLASLVKGISVGSEDLYRVTPTAAENKAGIGAGPDVVTSYIGQVKQAISGTALSGAPIGHVDTWTAWVNGSNSAVIDACDWIGVDAYPYYQTADTNSIQDAGSLFYSALDMTRAHAAGKDVWVTETGWPVSGPTENDAVASNVNARSYWEQVYCTLPSDVNVFWYTQSDADQASGVGSFGVVGSSLQTQPVYSLTCDAVKSNSSSSSSSSTASASHSSTKVGIVGGSTRTAVSGMSTKASTVTGTKTTTAASGSASSSGAIYPTGGYTAVVTGATGTGSAPTTATSSMATFAGENSASNVKSSLALLVIPAFLALFA